MKKFAGDIIILHMCTKNHNHMMYGSWDTEWDSEIDIIFCHSGLLFALLLPTSRQCMDPAPCMDPENKNFEKMKKTPADIIILQMCTINDSYMMYDSWDMDCNRQNFLSLWTIFSPLPP